MVMPYKDYIKFMEDKEYIHNGLMIIDESYPNIETYNVPSISIGKILNLSCPNNIIVSACGTSHYGGCPNSYHINIQCYNNEDKEPFQDLHHSTKLTDNYHVAAELIVTKILNKDPNEIDPNYKEWAVYNNPMLKLINSSHPYEHVMWAGVYKLFSKEFLKNSFNLNPNEELIFYAIKPDIDITKVKFSLTADIFTKNK